MSSEDFITEIIKSTFPEEDATEIKNNSYLIQYFINKMKSVSSSSKSRGSFGSIYPIFTLVEDYIAKGFDKNELYKDYLGAQFTDIFARQRELPFGERLQNHGFNNRVNDDFRKYFTKYGATEVPINRDLGTKMYWINEKLLIIKLKTKSINIAALLLNIVNTYISLKQGNFDKFFTRCKHCEENFQLNPKETTDFIVEQLQPNVDARIFEIISFVITKYYYYGKKIYIGVNPNELEEKPIELYKTGRTNANDGGIDFIMQPFGRFFQVTEVLNFKKYFLDIDKLNKFPLTFVVKSKLEPDKVMNAIKRDAENLYSDKAVMKKYLDCFEEIITIPTLNEYLIEIVANNHLKELLNEVIIQCKVEYNIHEENEEVVILQDTI